MTKKRSLTGITSVKRIGQIAASVHKYQGQPQAAAKTCKEAKCGGKTVKLVTDMIMDGNIVFNDEGEPQILLTMEKIVERYGGTENKLTIKDQSEAVAFETLMTESASEGRGVVLRWAKLGKAVEQAIIPYLLKKGWTLEDIVDKPIHGTLLTALNKEELVEPLQSENQELRSQLEFYKRETSPAIRAKEMMRVLNEFIEIVVDAANKGIDLTGTEVVQWYDRLLAGYLTGKMPGNIAS